MPTPYDDNPGPGAFGYDQVVTPSTTAGGVGPSTTPVPTTTTTTDGWRRDATRNPINAGQQPRTGYVWAWNSGSGQWEEVADRPPTDEGSKQPSGASEGYDFSRPTPWEFPEFSAPKFSGIGNFTPPPAFQYDAFRAPSLEDARNEPGYEFARGEGQRALETSAAARGIARTGGTLKDLISWGNKFGEQNYGNVFNRGAQTYGMNRENALGNYLTNYNVSRDTFNTNYGQARDIYDRDYQGAIAEFNPKFEGSRMRFEDMYRRWRDGLDANTRIVEAGARTD